jgi:cyclopropane fatty-acyl-phospholipid synthase-like methyltransferase
MATQTFYFTLLSLMNLSKAKHILEIGCGAGKLIPLAIMLKNE